MLSPSISFIVSSSYLLFTRTALSLPSSQSTGHANPSAFSLPLVHPSVSTKAPTNATNVTYPASNGVVSRCNPTLYGYVRYESCEDALHQIPWLHSMNPLSFGRRGMGPYDVTLPFRVISRGSPSTSSLPHCHCGLLVI